MAHDNQSPPQDNQVPPLKQVAMDYQVPVVPLPMIGGEIRAVFFNLTQAMTSQANVVTSQVQTMTRQVNRKVVSQVPQHASTMASRLKYITRMNLPMFFGLKSDEYPQHFLDEVN